MITTNEIVSHPQLVMRQENTRDGVSEGKLDDVRKRWCTEVCIIPALHIRRCFFECLVCRSPFYKTDSDVLADKSLHANSLRDIINVVRVIILSVSSPKKGVCPRPLCNLRLLSKPYNTRPGDPSLLARHAVVERGQIAHAVDEFRAELVEPETPVPVTRRHARLVHACIITQAQHILQWGNGGHCH
jgi:hypothetical protein